MMPTRAQDLVASPCNNVCRLDDARGVCLGCYRTLDEISAWSRVADDERRRIVAAAALRRRESAL